MNGAAIALAVTDLVALLIYLFLGWRFSQRRVSPQNRLSVLQFALFWLGLAAVTLIGGVESGVAAFVTPSLALVVTLFYIEILVLCGALWGLIGYLVHIYTGRAYLIPITGLYALLYVLLVYFVTASMPSGVIVMQGGVGLTYATQVGGPILGVLVVILVIPELLGSILYFTLFFRTKDRTARYRIALASWGLLAYFGLDFANIDARLGGGIAAIALGGALSMIPVLVILIAYFPPRVVRDRLGVSGMDTVTYPLAPQ